jgi:hypothetical protein
MVRAAARTIDRLVSGCPSEDTLLALPPSIIARLVPRIRRVSARDVINRGCHETDPPATDLDCGREVRVSSQAASNERPRRPATERSEEAQLGAPPERVCGWRGHPRRPTARQSRSVSRRRLERNVDLETVARDDSRRKNLACLALELGCVARVASRDVSQHELFYTGLRGHLGGFARG